MGFWDTVGKIVRTIAEEGRKQQGQIEREAARQVRNYERKVENAERKSDQMSPEQKKKIKEAREKVEKAKQNLSDRGFGVSSDGSERYGNKGIETWNSEWKSLGMLKDAELTPYNKSVGLYRLIMNGEIMYIGRAIELNNGGFRKRLSDYRRDSDSARKHKSGSTINENLDKITVDVLVVGTDENAVEVTRRLEGPFIQKYGPPWNVQLKS